MHETSDSRCVLIALALAFVGISRAGLAQGPHRLDPLSAGEIQAAVGILRGEGKASPGARFVQVALREPPKDSAWKPSSRPAREALAILVDRPGGSTFEAVVDLGAGQVRSWSKAVGGKPPLFPGDYAATARVVRADPRFREAIRKRGIADPEAVQVDAWAPGGTGPAAPRMARALFFFRPEGGPAYLRPIGNLVALVDLDALRVVELLDLGVVPVPGLEGGIDVNRSRPALAPLRVELPRGLGFERSGREYRWQGWRLRFSMEPRDGLVLREVGIEDGGKLRPVLYRGSLSELLVPYGDPARDWSFRNAFDAGEYGIGRFADSLEPGVDCPENAIFADAVFADEAGVPYEVPRAVGVFERDGGILWKHSARGRPEARRSRELVVCSSSTLGNYVYAFEWAFRQDGSIAVEVRLTGIPLAKGVDPARPAGPSGLPVARGVLAVHHQHFFNFRLDLDVDGPAGNRVSELNIEALPEWDDNPLGNAFMLREEDLASEARARRTMSLSTARRWMAYNPAVRTPQGRPAGYRLLPGENALSLASTSAPVRRRAGFLDAHFWATRFDPAELHASGPYPNQNEEDGGLGGWTRADRPLLDQDVVLWYTMGVTHVPRPEDWPVMSAHRAGFSLVPDGFFPRNPALDVPEAKP